MLTKLEFLHQLKDASKQGKKDIFKRFLEKHRNTFKTIISIQYSDKKYNNIDIEEIFYKDFLAYTIEQLNRSEKSSSVDSWVLTLAEKRAKDISEKVTKYYAKHLLQTGGRENWDDLNVILRGEAFSKIIGNIVKKYFDHPKYGGYHNEIKLSLLMQLYLSRVDNPTPIEKIIDDIDAYIYSMLKNLAIRKNVREAIEVDLGLRDDSADVSIYGRSDAEEYNGIDDKSYAFDADDEGCQYDEDEVDDESSLDDGCEMNDMEDQEEENETTVEALLHDPTSVDDRAVAEQKLEKILNLMPRKDQADLLRKVMLYGYDRVELAEEMGCSRAVLDNKVSRAMIVLYEVALPQIRQECKHMVITNRDALTDEYQRDILSDYFLSNNTLKELAQKYGKKEADFTADLIKAYKKVKSISSKTKRVFVSDKDIEKYEEEERKQEAKGTLIKTKLTTLKL